MGGDEVSSTDERGGALSPVPAASRGREVPLGHALLVMVVAALGVLLLVQSLATAPRPVEVVDQGTVLAAPAPPAARVASVADAILLRAAFSAVPDLRATSPGAAPGRAASVTTGLFGASGLRPAGIVLPSRTIGMPREAVTGVLWAAYESAARRVRESCHLSPSLLAAIGEVESGSLAGRRLDARHNVVPPVLGPTLSGSGVAAIRDTDGGQWDGDRTWDRAVGPMQFIPGTWRSWGTDGNGDGIADPQNVEDATYSAARYLCAGGRDLSDTADLRAAILSYNRSMSYLARVLELMATIEPGALPRLGVATAPRTQAPTPSTPSMPTTSYAVPLAPTGPTSMPAPTLPTSPTAGTEPGATESSSPPAPASSSPTPTPTSPTTSITTSATTTTTTSPAPSSPSSTDASADSATAADGTDVSSTGDLQGGTGQPTTGSASSG